jgi:beta-lactamase class A
MAQTYQDIYDGKLQLTDKLSQPIEALNSYFAIATDSARLSQGVVTYTVREALEEMITNSHDYASLLLAQRVGTPRMREFLRRHRFDHSTFDSPPQTTASDIAAFFEKLYLGELASSAHTHEMLTLLELQNLNYGIPKYLPNTIRILHKTGTLGSVSHDAGIVYSPEGGEDYIIVILTNTPDTREAENTIALLSRDVYDYFRAKNKR